MHISQRNARVLISDPRNRVGLDAAHYKMLCALCNQSVTPTERFLSAVQSSCFAQQTAYDGVDHVRWSRHLLSCLRRTLGADLFIGARAVALNPHFQHFFSPDAIDLELGGVQSWPAVPALLLLDSFAPTESPNHSTSIESPPGPRHSPAPRPGERRKRDGPYI